MNLKSDRRLIFLRHGQTDTNVANRWLGWRDELLNKEGQAQALLAAKSLANIRLAWIFSSPLQRAVQTAGIVAKQQTNDCRCIQLDDLKERNFGPLEGQSKTDKLREKMDTTPGVEQQYVFSHRIARAMCAIQKHSGHVLIVSHSAVFRCLINHCGYTSSSGIDQLQNAQYVTLFQSG